jgi:hypothetical protein
MNARKPPAVDLLPLNKQGIELDDWLLTESVRRREQRDGRWRDDAAAVALAQDVPADFAQRLVARARALPGLGPVQEDLDLIGRRSRQALLAVSLLGVLAGWLAALAVVSERQLDLLLATTALIGLPGLMLLLWVLFLALSASRSQSGSLLGRLFSRVAVRLGPRVLQSPLAPELAQTTSTFLFTLAGRWWISLAAHLLWLGFSVGALLGLLLHFSLAQYDLAWGTTILGESTVASAIHGLAWLPETLGWVAPLTDEFIERGRVGGLAGEDRALWARLLMSWVVLYVALPRIVMVLASWLRFCRCRQGMVLSPGEPAYLRLRGELMPDEDVDRRLGEAPPVEPDRPLRSAPVEGGRAVLIGLELDDDSDRLLASRLGDSVVHLGSASRRSQRQAMVEALKALRPPPEQILVVCSLLRTPDAGTFRQIDRLADAARSALRVVLVDAEKLRRRGGSLTDRLDDWRQRVRSVGGRLVVLDSDALDRSTLDALLEPIRALEEDE